MISNHGVVRVPPECRQFPQISPTLSPPPPLSLEPKSHPMRQFGEQNDAGIKYHNDFTDHSIKEGHFLTKVVSWLNFFTCCLGYQGKVHFGQVLFSCFSKSGVSNQVFRHGKIGVMSKMGTNLQTYITNLFSKLAPFNQSMEHFNHRYSGTLFLFSRMKLLL